MTPPARRGTGRRPVHSSGGPGARVAELLAHHETRLTGLPALLTDPLTPWQLAERMEWNRPWAQIPYGSRTIAVSEAESHPRRLVKLGRAEAVPGSDPATYVAVRATGHPPRRPAPSRPRRSRRNPARPVTPPR